jgi:hypothetical protein
MVTCWRILWSMLISVVIVTSSAWHVSATYGKIATALSRAEIVRTNSAVITAQEQDNLLVCC